MDEYIEKQAAIDAIVNCTNCGTPDELRKDVDKHSLENGWTGGVLDAMEAVDDMPAADVVKVRHAKDVYKQYNKHHCEFMCSLCGGWIGVIEGGDCDFNYCPNCGAKMDGERKEQNHVDVDT